MLSGEAVYSICKPWVEHLGHVYLGLVIHNHQPVGNFPWVFEQAYRQTYLPMIEALRRHPTIRLSLHYSGCLFDWLEESHPEFLSCLAGLVERQQVELVGGAYYEPILPAIPDADKIGQITKMEKFLKRKFGVTPCGFWLAERVWEPHLVKVLADAGVDWTLLDDGAFKALGLKERDLLGYYITEEQGKHIRLFPISKLLRYSIPWRPAEEVIDFLKAEALISDGKIAVFGDDGEKFGVWPGTYKLCWQDGWVEDFFGRLEANREWLSTIPLSEYISKFSPLGRVYLPCAAYDEMMEWSLPAYDSWEYVNLKRQLETDGREDIKRYMYCGFWRNFLVKYPEINRMYRKMLFVHQKVHQAHALGSDDSGLEELWKAQCNCPYWHGIFGGIYLADIRATTYQHLIQAENKADRVIQGRYHWLSKVWRRGYRWLKWHKIDFDGDGAEELLVESNEFSFYVSPAEGGSIFEWDIRSHDFNILSTLARRPEAYHVALAKTSDDETTEPETSVRSIHDSIRIKDKAVIEHIVYDGYPRSSMLDHFFALGTSMEEFANRRFEELGDFINQQYDAMVTTNGYKIKLDLRRDGRLLLGNGAIAFDVQKQISYKYGEKAIHVSYQLRNAGEVPVRVVFGNEWNINLLAGGRNQKAYCKVPELAFSDYLDSWNELEDVRRVIVGNHYLGIELELRVSPNVRLWQFPVESISNSEGGVEKLYQASCLVLCLPLFLSPGEAANLCIEWHVSSPNVSVE